MKLVRLTILEKFRSLDKVTHNKNEKDFSVTFREDTPSEEWEHFHPYCFAGLNGSGKSNVLEALSNIFYHLECCTLEKETSLFLQTDFKPEVSDPMAYELEYYIIPRNAEKSIKNYQNVVIRKDKNATPKIKVKALDQVDDIPFMEITGSIRTYLPELVIGYSSGENEILSLPFIKSRLL